MHSFEIVTPDRGIAAALHNKIDRKTLSTEFQQAQGAQ